MRQGALIALEDLLEELRVLMHSIEDLVGWHDMLWNLPLMRFHERPAANCARLGLRRLDRYDAKLPGQETLGPQGTLNTNAKRHEIVLWHNLAPRLKQTPLLEGTLQSPTTAALKGQGQVEDIIP